MWNLQTILKIMIVTMDRFGVLRSYHHHDTTMLMVIIALMQIVICGTTTEPSSFSPPSEVPTIEPSESENPTIVPTAEQPSVTTTNNDEYIDIWSIVPLDDHAPQVVVGQEQTLFVRVESNFILFNPLMIEKALVQIFPFDQCGVGLPLLAGTGEIDDDDDDSVDGVGSDSSNPDAIIYTAIFDIQDLDQTTFWDPMAKTAMFCGRVALAEGDILVSFNDMNFEFIIDLATDFSVSDNVDPGPAGIETLSLQFRYTVSACICNIDHECFDKPLPTFGVGSSIHVCVFPPPDEDVVISNVWELKIHQIDTGVFRFPVFDGNTDSLTSIDVINSPFDTAIDGGMVVGTTLDSQFFGAPEHSLELTGLVLVEPSNSDEDRSRRLRPHHSVDVVESSFSSASSSTTNIKTFGNIQHRTKDVDLAEVGEGGTFKINLELSTASLSNSGNRPPSQLSSSSTTATSTTTTQLAVMAFSVFTLVVIVAWRKNQNQVGGSRPKRKLTLLA